MQSSSLCIKVSFSTILNLKILVGNSKNHACRSKKIQDVEHFSPLKETDSSSIIPLVYMTLMQIGKENRIFFMFIFHLQCNVERTVVTVIIEMIVNHNTIINNVVRQINMVYCASFSVGGMVNFLLKS